MQVKYKNKNDDNDDDYDDDHDGDHDGDHEDEDDVAGRVERSRGAHKLLNGEDERRERDHRDRGSLHHPDDDDNLDDKDNFCLNKIMTNTFRRHKIYPV